MSRRGVARCVAVACVLMVSGCGWTGLQGVQLPGGAASGGRSYRVTVEFQDVLDLVPQSAVKVNDVTVGTVETVRLHGWTARVRLRISGSVKLPANATAELGQTSLLGEKYVSLAAPSGVKPVGRLTDGADIPLSRSGRNTEVEEVLSALAALLNGGGVAQLHTITVELNKALGGREDRVKDLLGQLDTFVGGLDAQRADIVRALAAVDRLSGSFAARHTTIARAVDTLPAGLKALADERADLTTMLTSLSGLGTVATKVIDSSRDDTLANLRHLDPILTRLDAAGTDLPNALELLTTYPFPRNVTGAVKGDYVNLDATVDLNLAKLYGNLLGPVAPKPSPTKPPSPTTPPKGKGGQGLLPGLPLLPLPTPSPGGPGGSSGGILCPLLCIGGDAAYGTAPGSSDTSGVDPSLAELMTQGVQG